MKRACSKTPGETSQGIRPALRQLLASVAGWFALMFFVLGAPAVCSAEKSLSEYQVKALCLVNFARYTEWPPTAFADTNAPIILGILGENHFRASLEAATAGKTIGGRTVKIRYLNAGDDCTSCQILFVGATETKRLTEILAKVKAKPVLTVGESETFLQQGGVINFAIRAGRVRFDVNLDAAHEAGTQISSKVLSLADEVSGKP
jgi:hypothetical protein